MSRTHSKRPWVHHSWLQLFVFPLIIAVSVTPSLTVTANGDIGVPLFEYGGSLVIDSKMNRFNELAVSDSIGRYLYVVEESSALKRVDALTRKALYLPVPAIHATQTISGLAVGPDDSTIALTVHNSFGKKYTPSGSERGYHRKFAEKIEVVCGDTIYRIIVIPSMAQVAFAKDGSLYAIDAASNLYVYDLKSGGMKMFDSCSPLTGSGAHTRINSVISSMFIQDDRLYYVECDSSYERNFQIWYYDISSATNSAASEGAIVSKIRRGPTKLETKSVRPLVGRNIKITGTTTTSEGGLNQKILYILDDTKLYAILDSTEFVSQVSPEDFAQPGSSMQLMNNERLMFLTGGQLVQIPVVHGSIIGVDAKVVVAGVGPQIATVRFSTALTRDTVVHVRFEGDISSFISDITFTAPAGHYFVQFAIDPIRVPKATAGAYIVSAGPRYHSRKGEMSFVPDGVATATEIAPKPIQRTLSHEHMEFIDRIRPSGTKALSMGKRSYSPLIFLSGNKLYMQNLDQDHQPYKLTWLHHLPDPDIQILDLSCQQFPLDWGICYFYASDGRFYEVSALGISFPMDLLGYQPNLVSFIVQMSDLHIGEWKFYLNLGDRILQKDYQYEASWTGLISSTHIATPEFGFELECRTGKYDPTQTAVYATTLIDGDYWVVSAKWGGGEVSQPIHTAKIYAGALVVSKNDELLYVFNTQTKLINAIRLVASPNSDAIGTITVFGSNRPFNCLDGVHMLLSDSETMVVAYNDATIESARIERVAFPALPQASVRSLGLACRLSFEPASSIERGLYVFLEHEQPWIRTQPFTVLLKCGGVALGDTLMTQAIEVPNRNIDRQVLIRPTADGEIWCSYTIEGDDEFDSARPRSTISAYVTETSIQIEEDIRRREFRVGSSAIVDI